MGILSERTALVTGAASGIGAAIAGRIAADGARVFVVDRDEIGLKELAEVTPHTVPLPFDLDAELDLIGSMPDDVDVLINCAGFLELGPIDQVSDAAFDATIRTMVTAPFRLIRHVMPHMRTQQWGRIINIGSVHSLVAAPHKAPYVTAKHAMEGLSKVVALEGAQDGITCVTVCPTHVWTPLAEAQTAREAQLYGLTRRAAQERMLGQPAVPRFLEPWEVGEAVAFCYGPASASMSGAPLVLDGAWSAR